MWSWAGKISQEDRAQACSAWERPSLVLLPTLPWDSSFPPALLRQFSLISQAGLAVQPRLNPQPSSCLVLLSLRIVDKATTPDPPLWPLFFFFNIYLFYLYVYIYVSVNVCVCRYPWRLEGGFGSLGAAVTGIFEPSDLDAGIWTLVPW